MCIHISHTCVQVMLAYLEKQGEDLRRRFYQRFLAPRSSRATAADTTTKNVDGGDGQAAQTQQELAAPTAAEWLEGGLSPGRSPPNVEKGREAGMSTQVQIHLRLTIGDVEIP